MKITLNGEEKIIEAERLIDLCRDALHASPPKGVAIAVNFKIIPKQQWDSYQLKEGDQVEIVHAVQGG